MFNFPSSPTVDQIFVPPGGPTFKWNGYGWLQIVTDEHGIEEAPTDGQQYARSDADWEVVEGVPSAWADIAGKPATFPPTLPIAQADVTGLVAGQSAQDTAISGKAATVHTHAQSDVTNLVSDLSGKAPTSHTHTTAQVTGLDTALAGKSDTSHTHAYSSLTSIPSTFAPSAHNHPQSEVTNLVTDLAAKEPSLPGGGTTSNFLRGDKTWAVPAGGGGGIAEPVSGNNLRQNGAWVAGVQLGGDTMTGKLTLPAATTSSAPINISNGATASVSPTTPLDGDVWINGSFMLFRGSGVTQTIVNLANSQAITGNKTLSGTTTLSGPVTASGTMTFSATPVMVTSTASLASLRLPHGVAVTSLTNGDVWTTTAGMFARINGATKQVATNITVASSAPSSPATGDVWIDTT